MRSALLRVLPIGAVLAALTLGIAACGGADSEAGDHAGHDQPAATTGAAPTASAEGATAAFVRQMIPHHEMAVEMAKVAQARTKRAEIKKMTGEVIAAQTKEIAELKAIAKADDIDVSDASAEMATDAKTLGLDESAMGMSMDMKAFEASDDVDRAFLNHMIPHHDGALAMSAAVLNAGATGEVQTLAEGIVKAQAAEIAEMQTWRKVWFGDAASTTPSDDMGGHEGHDMSGMN